MAMPCRPRRSSGRCVAAGCCCRAGFGPIASPGRLCGASCSGDPPSERNRVWQTDFSEFETPSSGIWRICAVIDYATKFCLAATVGPTARGADALACLNAAVAEAQRVLCLDDLRADRGTIELVDETTGEIIDVVPSRHRPRVRQWTLLPRRDQIGR